MVVKSDPFTLTMLFDYYGDLLTEKQKTCFDLYYNQDLSLAEIAAEAKISRQGVHDSLARAEAALRTIEEKTGCVSRDLKCRKNLDEIAAIAQALAERESGGVCLMARRILALTNELKEQ